MDVNTQLLEDGFETRTKDAISAKIRALEDNFKRALTWIHSTGAGSYSLEPDDNDDGLSPYQRELNERCKYYNELVQAFGDRGSMIPEKLYSTLASEGNREAEEDIVCALGLKKWSFEDSDSDDSDDTDKTGEEDGKASERAKKKRRLGSGASSISRNSRSTGSVKAEDVSYYLVSKGRSEDARLGFEKKKLRSESKKARAEGIAVLFKADLSLADAKAAWDDGPSESESD